MQYIEVGEMCNIETRGRKECDVDKTVLSELIWSDAWPDGRETSTAREERRGSCGGRPVYEFV